MLAARLSILGAALAAALPAPAQTRLLIMPPDRSTLAVGQRFDIRVEATGTEGGPPPSGLRVFLDGTELTARNILDAPPGGGDRGAGGTGATAPALPAHQRASASFAHTSNFLLRDHAFARAGAHTLEARTADGATASVRVEALSWDTARPGGARARNIILLLGDGMGLAHRTAARMVSRGYADGRARAPLAMDTMPVTGQVMTSSLNAVLTDSAPGMSCYITGNKSNNNQEGVFPDNTRRRLRQPAHRVHRRDAAPAARARVQVGIVTTADVTDATPAANAVHTADRSNGPEIAQRFFEERERNGLAVLLGGGAHHFAAGKEVATWPRFKTAGFTALSTAADVKAQLAAGDAAGRGAGPLQPVAHAGGLRQGGRRPLQRGAGRPVRDQPMLDDMARLALEGALHACAARLLPHDRGRLHRQAGPPGRRRAHGVGHHRVRQRRARGPGLRAEDQHGRRGRQRHAGHRHRRPRDGRAGPDRRGQRALRAEGPGPGRARLRRGLPLRRRAGAGPLPQLRDGRPGFPRPSRSVAQAPAGLGGGARPVRELDLQPPPGHRSPRALLRPQAGRPPYAPARANDLRDSGENAADNRTVEGTPIPGFKVEGIVENGQHACADPTTARATPPRSRSTSPATPPPTSCSRRPGAGAAQFTGTFDNTAVFIKMLRATSGDYRDRVAP